MKNGFSKGKVDTSLFIKKHKNETDGEVANLCFMDLEEPSNNEVTLDFKSNDEILLACKKLMHKCNKYLFRIISLKEMVKTLEEKLEKSRL